MQSSENFYLLLGLSIEPQEQDENKIENAINKKRNEWSMLRNHPTKAVKAKFYLSLVPEIKRVMLGNAYERKEEWKKALRIKKQEEKDKFKLLDECIQFLCSKGTIFEEEVKSLESKFGTFSKDEIMKRIKVPVHLNKKNSINKIVNEKKIDSTIINKIKTNLEIVNAKSLYDFLKVSKDSPVGVLKMASKYKYDEIRKIAAKDAINTASSILQGLCDDIFKDEESKRAYDSSLKSESVKYVEMVLEISASKGYVSSEEFDNLIANMIEDGIEKNEAKNYIKNICANKKISLQVPLNLSINFMQRCSICGSVNYRTAKFCYNCGSSLKVSCPKCHKIVSSQNEFCDNCGTNIKNSIKASQLIADSERYVYSGNIEKAYFLISEAVSLCPENEKALKLMKSIKNKRIIILDREDKIQRLIEKKQYYAAMKELIALKQINYSNLVESLENLIGSKIGEVQKKLTKANEFEDKETLDDIYSSILNICSDCDEALKWMTKYPPEAPRFLRHKVVGDGININWDSNNLNKNVTYKVIRKMRTEPSSIEDGKFICETHENEITDYTAEPGQNYYYAVFAVRGGSIYSRTFSVVGPVMRIADVEDVEVECDCGKINLSWTSSTKTREVEVWRKEGELPSKRGDGIKLNNVLLFGVEDVGLTNGSKYGYLIISLYRDAKDHEIASEGVTCFGKPIVPPEVITDIKLSNIDNGVRVNFKRKSFSGKVYILYSNEPFEFEEGQVIKRDKLSKIDNKAVIKKEGECDIKNIDDGVLFVVALTAEGNIASVGKQVHISFLKDVENLTGYILNKKIYLQWRWPEGIKKVVVGWRCDDFCDGVNDPKANYKEVNFDNYSKDAAFIFDKLNMTNYFFTVFTINGSKYVKRYSYGKDCKIKNTGFMEIYYEIKRSKGIFGFSKGITFLLKNEFMDEDIPKYVLVANMRSEPSTVNDGDIVYKGNEEKVVLNDIDEGIFIRPFIELSKECEKYKFVRK